jgi:hypothetical protein
LIFLYDHPEQRKGLNTKKQSETYFYAVFIFQAPNGSFFWRSKRVYLAQGGRTEKIDTVLEFPSYKESDYVFKTFL